MGLFQRGHTPLLACGAADATEGGRARAPLAAGACAGARLSSQDAVAARPGPAREPAEETVVCACPTCGEPLDPNGACQRCGAEASSAATRELCGAEAGTTGDLAVPERLGDFEIVREIGRGGMGVVYEARQTSLNRRVALKVLPLDRERPAESFDRFRREAEAAAGLEHDHIVRVYATGEDGGRL